VKAFLKPLIFASTLITIAGCASMAEYMNRLLEPRPDTGTVPAVDIGTAIPTVAGNPLNFDAWAEIAKALVYVIGGGGLLGGGVYALKRRKKSGT
jgi:hypothetical protein